MANAVEHLEKLKRRVTLSLSNEMIKTEANKRLQKIAKTFNMRGFRPGKVPLKIVETHHGAEAKSEVIAYEINRLFDDIVKKENIHIAGQAQFSLHQEEDINSKAQQLGQTEEKKNAQESPQQNNQQENLLVDVNFEVYPEVNIEGLSQIEITRIASTITEEDIDKTIEVIRTQRAVYQSRQPHESDLNASDLNTTALVTPDISKEAQNNDRITVDFVGRIDDKEFDGGSAENHIFLLGQKNMLPEFEEAVIGLKKGEQREFNLTFPDNYHESSLAGKTAQFTITVKEVEFPTYPVINEEFAKSLGIEDGDINKLRVEIRQNMEQEVLKRTKALNKNKVMDALCQTYPLDVPETLCEMEVQRLTQLMRQQLKQRSGAENFDIEKIPLPTDLFKDQAARRCQLGLILEALISAHQLKVTPEQIREEIENLSKSYDNPEEFVTFYSNNKARIRELETFILENNVVDYILSQAKVTENQISFDELSKETPTA